MNAPTPVFASQPTGVSFVRNVRGFASFHDPACAAAIWDRKIPTHVATWLDKRDADGLPNGRVLVLASAVPEIARHLCDIAKMPNCQQRDWLVDDIAALARRFSDIMQAVYMRLRLQVVTTNACRKFHTDAITGRLLCTYRGTGTQYGTAARGRDPEHIFTVPTGAPVLLRGSLWPPNPASALVHRSPPIEGTGETRLVLVLDPIYDLEEPA